jgi:hypothetical protein
MAAFQQTRNVIAMILLAGGLTACATGGATGGPTFTGMNLSSSTPPGGMARIYMYRASQGIGLQPPVRINDTIVGDALTNGFFYVDRRPGNYKISASAKVEDDLIVSLEPGQIKYVQFVPQFGVMAWHIRPELVTDTKGQHDIVSSYYTGK